MNFSYHNLIIMKSPIVHLSKDELKTVYLFKNLMSHDAPFFFPTNVVRLVREKWEVFMLQREGTKNPPAD